MRVVVGKASEPAPMIARLPSNAVLNPYWNARADLIRSRIAWNVNRNGVGYLKATGYQALSDWSGRADFMGKVKFDFPNNQAIYLCDTPDTALLKAEARIASSGCVRLGAWLIGRDTRGSR